MFELLSGPWVRNQTRMIWIGKVNASFPYFIVSTGFIREALNACHATVSVPITTAAIPIKINDTGEISFYKRTV